VLVTCMITRSLCFFVTVAPVCRIWCNKIISILLSEFGVCREIKSPPLSGGNRRFPLLVPNHTIIQGLAATPHFHCFKFHGGRALFALPSHLASIRVLFPTMLPARRNKVDISVRLMPCPFLHSYRPASLNLTDYIDSPSNRS
jgi:hypothetical protein